VRAKGCARGAEKIGGLSDGCGRPLSSTVMRHEEMECHD
jgi:hypothetical protein